MRSSHHVTKWVLPASIAFQNAVVFGVGTGPRSARTGATTESSPGSARPRSSTVARVASTPRCNRSAYWPGVRPKLNRCNKRAVARRCANDGAGLTPEMCTGSCRWGESHYRAMNFREIGNTPTPGLRRQHRGHRVIVHVLGQFLQIRDGNELVKTVTRTGKGGGRIRVPRGSIYLRARQLASRDRKSTRLNSSHLG